MIDTALVIRKITLISGDLKEILKLSDKTQQEFLSESYLEVLAERFLERVIGRMIDINFHIITETGHPPPRDYYDSFLKLGSIGILPADLARQLAACTGLRNRIVHEYDEIDAARVHEGLRAAARDVPLYLKRIETYIDSLEGCGDR